MKYYLIKTNEVPTNAGGVENFLFLTELSEKTYIELTEDDYGLILDALYEQAIFHNALSYESSVKYAKACRKVAKKFERIFKDEK